MESINEEKKQLRRKIRDKKRSLSLDEKKRRSTVVTSRIEKLPAFQQAKKVMVYWSLPDEVHTHDFVQKWAQEKEILLPVVKGPDLELRYFTGMKDMQQEPVFGIFEPTGPIEKNPGTIDMIIVPGVAFDDQKNRMGRGKAFYDKLLQQTEAFKAGICFDFQLLPRVPVDEHDIPMDVVVAETVEK